MSNSTESINFSNLKDKQQELEQKSTRFNNFASFVGGLLLGAVFSFPLQLFLRPLSYESSSLTYGPRILLDPAPVWLIPLISIILLFGLIITILVGYTIWIGLIGQETVKLTYDSDDYDTFYENVRDYLDREAGFVDVEIKAKNNWIKCLDSSRRPSNGVALTPISGIGMSILMELLIDYAFPKTVLELDFNPKLSVIELRYDPNSENANHLLEKLETEYRKTSEIDG